METGSQELSQHFPNITIENSVGVSSEVVLAAQTAIDIVMSQHLGNYDDLNVIFASQIVDADGNPMKHHAEAFPDGRTIVFAMDAENMKGWIETFGPLASMLLLSAHEAKHIVQFRSGDAPPNSATLNKETNEYVDEPHEVDAWEESFHVFKKIRPGSSGSLMISGKKYTIPERSKYADVLLNINPTLM